MSIVKHGEKRALFPEERELFYAKYYDLDFRFPDEDEADILNDPVPAGDVVRPDQLSHLIDTMGQGDYVTNGRAELEDGTRVTCTSCLIPGVTAEMTSFWFDFVVNRPVNAVPGHGNLRYKIWEPYDHFDHYVSDPADPYSILTIRETFDFGTGVTPLCFGRSKRLRDGETPLTPEQIALFREKKAMYIFAQGVDENGKPLGGMGVNLFIPRDGGLQWMDYSYTNWSVVNGRIVKLHNEREPLDMEGLRRGYLHNISERAHMAAFLPGLFSECRGKDLLKI